MEHRTDHCRFIHHALYTRTDGVPVALPATPLARSTQWEQFFPAIVFTAQLHLALHDDGVECSPENDGALVGGGE